MSETRVSQHGEWSNRWMFILAATGSAVGLGNIWKFPYIAGENGGGAFVLVYLFCILAIGVPVMMAEILLGRRGRQSPVNAMRTLAEEAERHSAWGLLGWAGMMTGFLILSYYSVIAGWALAYIPRMYSEAMASGNADAISGLLNDLLADPWQLLLYHTVFMALVVAVSAHGVRFGLERAVRWLMPMLFLLLLILVGYALLMTDQFGEGLRFLFNVDFQALFYPGCGAETQDCAFSGNGVLVAMGHAFFTLSLGMGAIMMYGAYLPANASITSTTVVIAAADTVVALLAGMAIFPIVFAHSLEPGAGPGLVFVTLPIAFAHIPLGIFFGTLFFILLVFAAWTSAISIGEPAVAWLVETRHWSRRRAAAAVGGLAWLLGILSVLSFNVWSDVKPLGFLNSWFEGAVLAQHTFFDLFDYLTSNVMLPLGGLFIAIFTAWILNQDAHHDELGTRHTDISYRTWLFLIRFITPLAVLIIFLNAIGVLPKLL